MQEVMLVFAISALSGFIHSLSGFGYAIVMMALLPFVLEGPQCVVLSLIGCECFAVWTIIRNWRKIKAAPVFWTTLFSTVSAVIGLLAGAKVAGNIYLVMLGAFLIILSLWMWKVNSKVRLPDTPVACATAGLINGVLGALFACGGPALGLYFNAATNDKETYMVSLQCAICVQSIIMLLLRVVLGLWPQGIAINLLPLLIGTVLGMLPGRLIYDKMDNNAFQKFIYIFMCVAGLFMIVTHL